MNMRLSAAWFVLACLCVPAFASHERITDLRVELTVQPDAELVVHEYVQVVSQGRLIRHGITRDFPIHYRCWSGLRAAVPFQMVLVTCDDCAVPFSVISYLNGLRVYVGDAQSLVSPGVHTYHLAYRVRRLLSFHATYDQLVWNVTGNDSVLPIEHVHALVSLPSDVPREQVQCTGYTGLYGQTGTDYQVLREKNGTYVFETTQTLLPGSGFTLDIAWPKGYVQPISWMGQIAYLVRDNLDLALLLLALLVLILFYAVALQKAWRAMPHATVIPLFHPPRESVPGAVRYVTKRHFDTTCLTAEIVRMAVLGYLTISYQKKVFSSGTYTLIKKETDPTKVAPEYQTLYNVLFAAGDRLELAQVQSASTVDAITDTLKLGYARQYAAAYFQSRIVYMWPALLISLGALLCALVLHFYAFASPINLLVCAVHALVHVASCALLPAYSYDGQQFKNEIDGFKLFLKTTEQERIKLVGTPPTRTPELYERYLPYAIALGVEKKWAAQFAPLFKSMEAQGHPYKPYWMIGMGAPWQFGFGNRLSQALRPNFSNALSSKPMSSGKWPGGSSGFGKGSSGSGGGGGGFGGW